MKYRIYLFLLFMACIQQYAFAQPTKKKSRSRKHYGHGVVAEAPPEPGIFVSVSQLAEFPGGNDSLKKFLNSRVRYPAAAREDEIQGKVDARILIDSAGKVARAELIRDIGGGCGKEVLRVLNTLPPWKPYRYNGRNIPFVVTLQVQFRLND